MERIDPNNSKAVRYTPMKYLDMLFDLIIDRIIAFTDYFIIAKKVTLSETIIFSLIVTRAFWLALVDVVQPYETIFSNQVWLYIYSIAAILHFVAYFLTTKFRGIAVCIHSFILCFLLSVAVYGQVRSFAIPSLSVLVISGIFIAVRLLRSNGQ